METDNADSVQGKGIEKRILVVTDTVETAAFTLGIAARLAVMSKARVETLFVEDIALSRLAALPFATELSSVSGTHRALTPLNVSTGFKEQVKKLRKVIDEVVARDDMGIGLSIIRGDLLTEAFSTDSDVLFITPPRQIARVDHSPVRRRSSSLNFAPKNLPVYVYLQTGSTTPNAIVIASKLAAHMGSDLVFLVPRNKIELVGEIRDIVENQEGPRPGIYFEMARDSLMSVASGVARRGCALFISSRKAFMEDGIQVAPRDVGCPMMFLA